MMESVLRKKEKWLKNLNYDKFEAHRLQNWALVQGKYYYVKQQRVLNEQVGEALAKKMWLPTSHNILGIKNVNNKAIPYPIKA